MPTSTTFQGTTLIQPQVVSAIDDTALAAFNIAGSATVGIVGAATGGAPNTALAFTRASDAAQMLRTGALLDCVRRAFDPGAGTPGAAKVIAIRGGAPTRSTLTLQDTVPANTVVLTSVDYGAWNNQIRVAVAAGTTQGKKLTLQAPDRLSKTGTIIGDNIYRASLSVLYTGAGSASTMTVSSTQLATSCTGASGDNVTLLFTGYTTLQAIADAMNATAKYTVAVLADPSTASTQLDGQTAVDIKSAAFTATSTLQACIDFFNTTPWVTAVRSTGILPPNTLATTYLASAVDGSAMDNTAYTTALTVLESQDTGLVGCDSGSAGVHALVVTHCTNMSGITGRKERIGLVGGVTGENVGQASTRAANLGSQRVGLVFPGFNDANPDTGVLTLYAPFVSAAAVMGMFAGDRVVRAATNKAFGATSMETALTDANIDTLLTAGVVPLKTSPTRGFRVVQSISTWTADRNFVHVELSVRRNADYVSRTVREGLEDLIGSVSGPSLAALITSRCNSLLRQLEFDGFIVGTPTVPAFKNISVVIAGATVTVDYTASVGIPANYILLTAHLVGFAATS